MIVLGLTGSVGMGKTLAAQVLRRLGAAVFDADAEVHRLLGPNGAAVAAVAQAFPEAALETTKKGAIDMKSIDRGALGARVFGDDDATDRLEAILHPLVAAATSAFLMAASARREKLAVLDVPLLFETGGADRCDAVAVVIAPAFLQAQRVLPRRGMTVKRLAAIRARQMPDGEKLRRADFIIHTGLDRRSSLRQLHRMVSILTAGPDRGDPHQEEASVHA